ncbi:nuclear transport factor 2 family protein [Flavobacterium sp. GA093]|uniref:Nuclear transport factor 2 family protein n=1 Tax=Flavobacterium hydrocarbonoxydans TaxID=2683249 RepID=A0A6I4NYU5_9FLAO|nr:nuclear transport factor 2 family protein [Flavobacterium hydrocarbonoxydans]MWB96207.1 nuclear transport factor 2 family protein [Flavobacterium hydrocarbonoxydans]
MTKKEITQDFLQRAARGASRQAFILYAGDSFKHHNVYFKGDGETLIKAMEESAEKNPDKIFTIHHILEDNDLVAVHSHVQQNETDLGAAVVHLFKFKEEKIIELWDLGQPIPQESINENGMF